MARRGFMQKPGVAVRPFKFIVNSLISKRYTAFPAIRAERLVDHLAPAFLSPEMQVSSAVAEV